MIKRKMRKILLAIFIAVIVFVEKSHSRSYSQQHYDSIKIGGLFDDTQEAEFIFKYAVRKTHDEQMLNNSMRRLDGDPRRIESGDEFGAAMKVCDMIENGALGIIGPTSTDSAVHVRNLCDAKEIPLVETRIDLWSKHVINLHPAPADLGRAYLDLINAWNWQGFTILYEDAPWLPVIDVIMRNFTDKYSVAVRQLDVIGNGNYRPRLLQVKQSEDKNIVICSSIEKLEEILRQAQQVGLLSDEHNVLITNLDMHTIDLEPFQYGGTNITGLRMIIPDDPFVRGIVDDLTLFVNEDRLNNRGNVKYTGRHEENYQNRYDEPARNANDDEDWRSGLTIENMRLSTALTYDAVMLFSKTLAGHIDINAQGVKDCTSPLSIFVNGTSIENYIRSVEAFKGLSGNVEFGHFGNRSNFNLDVLELVSDGLKRIGTWNSRSGVDFIYDRTPIKHDEKDVFAGKNLLVLTVDNEPYGMRKQSLQPLRGNEQFEGFCIELIEKLAIRIGFNYTFKFQEDKKYGNRQPDGSWNGMIGELMADQADLALTDLTITAEREEAADFTMPFMDLGISILFQKPKKEDPDLFSFLQPFSGGVWACVIGSFFLVAISLFIMGRMSPQEWDNPYPCIEEPTMLLNQFNMKNAIWFCVGALMQQGSEIAPKGPSTRIVASMWWFFTLIMVSSYTANLAAFLTIENPAPIIENVKELFENGQTGRVKYGAKSTGSTIDFFKGAEDGTLYKDMYNYMERNWNEVMMDSNDAGLAKAQKEKYAYFMESSTIEYVEQRKCDVARVGNNLDQKGYAIAMKKGSLYRGPLDEAILKMQESGELSRMKTKWWKEKRGGGACSSKDGDGIAEGLSMKNVSGIFVSIAIGSFFALVLGIVRWIQNIKKIARKYQMTFKEAFDDEFRFFRQFGENVKPMQRKNSSDSNSSNEASEQREHSRTRSHSRGTNHTEKENFKNSSKSLHKIREKLDESLI